MIETQQIYHPPYRRQSMQTVDGQTIKNQNTLLLHFNV